MKQSKTSKSSHEPRTGTKAGAKARTGSKAGTKLRTKKKPARPTHDAADPIIVADVRVEPGERKRIDVPVARSYGRESVLPVVVVRGKLPGPRLFVSAAIHGDEINGVEIIRRLLSMPVMKRLRGALLAVPVVNVYGFAAQSRYLPDRRDLNRAFPGSSKGSIGARLAHAFMQEVVSESDYGIDLHTGSNHRTNLPQIRACLDQKETEGLALAFGAPVVLNSNLRDGSLRQAVTELKIPMLLYEAGESLRFDEVAIRAGVRGILAIMRKIGMLPRSAKEPTALKPQIARSSAWVRAGAGGTLRNHVGLGDRVARGDQLGFVADPLAGGEVAVVAPAAGILIGRTNLPLVNEGDALYHLALFGRPRKAAARIETFNAELNPDLEPSPSGEPPII